MINATDLRSRKAGNGLKRGKQHLPDWFSRLGIHVKKKAAVSFLGTGVNESGTGAPHCYDSILAKY
jgi:hypothetical protein